MGILESIGLGLASKAVDYGISSLTHGRNVRSSKELAAFNDQIQRRLISDSPTLQKQGLQKAGLSVASLNGSFQSVSNSAQASTPTMSPPLGVDFLSAANLMAQNRLIEAQAKAQELSNKEKEDLHDAMLTRGESQNYFLDTKTGKKYSEDEYKSLPIEIRNEQGRFELEKVQPNRLSSQAYAVGSELARITSEKVKHNLDTVVNNLKLDDDRVKFALSRMDEAQFNNVVQLGKNMLHDEKIKKYASIIAEKTHKTEINKVNLEYDMLKLHKSIEQYNFEVSKSTDIGNAYNDMKKNFSMETFTSFLGAILVTLLKSSAQSAGSAVGAMVSKKPK